MMIIELILGTFFLYLGAEGLIKGGAALALRLGLPVLVIGLTIIGFGTSSPELVVSTQAALAGRGDITIGNVVGSNIVNTGLILGFCALLFPLPIHKRLLDRDAPFITILGFILFGIFIVTPVFTRTIGIALLSGLIIYTIWSIRDGMKSHIAANEPSPHTLRHWGVEIAYVTGGLALLVLGSYIFLQGAVSLAKLYGISDRVIGLTIVAIGTSMPEFATSVIAAMRKQGDIAVGNTIGSSIFNILGILGVAAIVAPIHVESINWIDFSYMVALFLGLWIIIRKGSHITRWEGAVLLLSYLVYLGYLIYF